MGLNKYLKLFLGMILEMLIDFVWNYNIVYEVSIWLFLCDMLNVDVCDKFLYKMLKVINLVKNILLVEVCRL